MVLSMDRWVGKVAVVTGASDGIGAEIVKVLLKNGVIVVGMARRKEKIQELSESKNLYSVKVDFRNETEIVDAIKWVNNNVGPIHILVNSVGTLWNTTCTDADTKLWRDQFDTDLFGLLIPTREVIKQMKDNEIVGHIIHIGGVSGDNINVKNFSALGACKSSIRYMTESLRQELASDGSKIKVSLLSPYYVNTKIIHKNAPEQQSLLQYAEFYDNMMSALDPSDVADSVIYLLSTPPHVQVHYIQIGAVGTKVHS